MLTLSLLNTERNYSFEASLDNEVFKLRFLWNPRAEAWFFDLVRSSNGKQLIDQKRVTVGAALMSQYVGPDWPKGELLVIDTTKTDTDPGEGDMGSRVVILYFEALLGEVTARV